LLFARCQSIRVRQPIFCCDIDVLYWFGLTCAFPTEFSFGGAGREAKNEAFGFGRGLGGGHRGFLGVGHFLRHWAKQKASEGQGGPRRLPPLPHRETRTGEVQHEGALERGEWWGERKHSPEGKSTFCSWPKSCWRRKGYS